MFNRRVELKNNQQLHIMQQAGLILHEALNTVIQAAQPGVSTNELDAIFAEAITSQGATSNFLGYYGFPATICASVNEEVVHGIPSDRVLIDGDVLKIDAGCIVDGWHSDSARTKIIGNVVDPEDQRLSDITEEAMWAGIARFATAKYVGEIGHAIEGYVTAQPGTPLGILEDYVGHGIGSEMHQPPNVFNYATSHRGPKIKPGMVLAIEPMLVRGDIETKTLADEWTVVTVDGANASQWEHTVARHRDGIWVMTAPDGGSERLAPYGVAPTPIPAR